MLPGAADPYGNDILGEHARRTGADMIITLMDAWVLAPETLQGLKVANWMPVDCSPLGVMDRQYLQRSGSVPIALSRYGQKALETAGFKALYVPHGVDMEDTFRPVRDRMQIRRDLGLPEDAFILGVNGANKDTISKSYPAITRAVAEFLRRHPEANALLLIHALTRAPGALDLQAIIEDQGLSQQVRFSDWYTYVTGQIKPPNLCAWYNALDGLTQPSHGEGSVCRPSRLRVRHPPVMNDHSAMTELAVPAGWWMVSRSGTDRSPGSPGTMPGGRPHMRSGLTCGRCTRRSPCSRSRASTQTRLHSLSRRRSSAASWMLLSRCTRRSSAARRKCGGSRPESSHVQYDADLVLERYWKPALKELEEM